MAFHDWSPARAVRGALVGLVVTEAERTGLLVRRQGVFGTEFWVSKRPRHLPTSPEMRTSEYYTFESYGNTIRNM